MYGTDEPIPVLAIWFCCLSLLLSPILGCHRFMIGDGGITIGGRAYEWLDAPAGTQSQILVESAESRNAILNDGSLPLSYRLVPLSEVKITLFHGGDYAEDPIKEDTVWKDEITTSPDGKFYIVSITNPREFHAAIHAEKPGYYSATEVFLHNAPGTPGGHKASILMVAERE